MDIFKKAADTVKSTVSGVQDAAKIYSQLMKEKQNLKASEEKINSLYADIGRMVYNDSNVNSEGNAKESIFLDVNYRAKLNVILGEKEKIKDIEKKISDINKLL